MFGLAFLLHFHNPEIRLHGQHVMLPILLLPQEIQPRLQKVTGIADIRYSTCTRAQFLWPNKPARAPPPCCILARTHSHVSLFLAVNTFKNFQCISIKIAFCHVKPSCALKKHTRLLFAFCDVYDSKSVGLVICSPTPLQEAGQFLLR